MNHHYMLLFIAWSLFATSTAMEPQRKRIKCENASEQAVQSPLSLVALSAQALMSNRYFSLEHQQDRDPHQAGSITLIPQELLPLLKRAKLAMSFRAERTIFKFKSGPTILFNSLLTSYNNDRIVCAQQLQQSPSHQAQSLIYECLYNNQGTYQVLTAYHLSPEEPPNGEYIPEHKLYINVNLYRNSIGCYKITDKGTLEKRTFIIPRDYQAFLYGFTPNKSHLMIVNETVASLFSLDLSTFKSSIVPLAAIPLQRSKTRTFPTASSICVSLLEHNQQDECTIATLSADTVTQHFRCRYDQAGELRISDDGTMLAANNAGAQYIFDTITKKLCVLDSGPFNRFVTKLVGFLPGTHYLICRSLKNFNGLATASNTQMSIDELEFDARNRYNAQTAQHFITCYSPQGELLFTINSGVEETMRPSRFDNPFIGADGYVWVPSKKDHTVKKLDLTSFLNVLKTDCLVDYRQEPPSETL